MENDSEIEVGRMSENDIQYLDIFFSVCKRYGIDYSHASEKQRTLVDQTAADEFAAHLHSRKGD